jgi:hypothetical protein
LPPALPELFVFSRQKLAADHKRNLLKTDSRQPKSRRFHHVKIFSWPVGVLCVMTGEQARQRMFPSAGPFIFLKFETEKILGALFKITRAR